MNNSPAISKAVRVALLMGAGATIAVPAAFAQDASQGSQAAGQNQAATTQLGKIEVTGTRILRTNVETAQPITVITAKQIQQSGLTSVGDLLTQITQAGASFNRMVNNSISGQAESRINLRYFGSNRVLVLVNGERWNKDTNGSVDLNTIPTSIIDHIEILQDGASAIYGSDAITGVINIITVKDFNGAQANAYMGMYDANGIGGGWDGKSQQYDFTMGGSIGSRGNVVFNATYSESDPIWASNRTYSNAFGPFNAGRQRVNSWFPNGRFIIDDPGVASIGQATPNSRGQFDMSPISVTDTPTLANFQNTSLSDWYTYESMLLTPLESKSVYMQGHYDLAENLTFTSMAQAVFNTGGEYLSPVMVSMGSSGFIQRNHGTFGVGANNPYNPFGKDLVANSSQWCPAGTLASGPNKGQACTQNILLVLLGKNITSAGPRSTEAKNTNYTYRMGLNGFFNALGSEWDWSLGSSFGQVTEDIDNFNMINTVNVATAVDAPGYAQCNGPGQATKPAGDSVQVGGLYYPIITPGCVPLNLFGGSSHVGYSTSGDQNSITPAMLKYIMYTDPLLAGNDMRDYTANITGSLVQLPAGPLAVALGGESLEEDGFSHPSGLEQSGNAYFGSYQPTDGREWTKAEYVEFNIPLVADVPLVKSLSLDLANRWSQFSWAGGEEGSTGFGVTHHANATTGQAKLRWQVSEDLLLRGSWSQGFRVPDINDLYAGQLQSFPAAQDPCAPSTSNGGWNPSTPLPAGCHGLVHEQLGGQIRTLGGANPSMTPETAISRSAGFVYNPSWFSGFDISADYFKIELGNVIGSDGPQYILNQCYLAQNSEYCSKITMVGDQITLIDNLNTNTGEQYSRGIDVNAHYRLPATAIGNFSLATAWTFEQSFVNVTSAATSPTGWQSTEERGFVGIPQRKGQFSVNWSLANWSAAWNVDYIGQQWTSCSALDIKLNECTRPDAFYTLGNVKTPGLMHVGTTLYHDVQVTYHADPINTNFTFGIQNLFDKLPPTDGSTSMFYRVGGRFVYARVGVKF